MHVVLSFCFRPIHLVGSSLLLLLTTACGVVAPTPTAPAAGAKAAPAPTKAGSPAQRPVRTAVIGFYNVENLFDTQDDPKTSDEEFTPTGFRQWDETRYRTKLRNVASVIAELGSPNGPDIVGINEAENGAVLRDLVAEPLLQDRHYEIVHFDSPDSRGIDVALLYRPDRFQLRNKRAVTLHLPDTTMGTRDLLVVDGLLNDEPITFMVAHWPSRIRGERSIKRRVDVARQCRAVIDEQLKANPQARVLLMGDLNDTPGDSSVLSVLRTAGSAQGLPAGTLFNPFYDLQIQGKGTMYYRSRPDVFDQMVMSGALAGTSGLRYQPGSVAIFKPERITSPQAKWPGEPLRTFIGRRYMGGYSDHFPVYITLTK